jgi:hypothetical protein
MLIGKIEHQWPLPRDEQQVNPDKIVKDPACGRVWDGLSHLFRKRRPIILEGCAEEWLRKSSATVADIDFERASAALERVLILLSFSLHLSVSSPIVGKERYRIHRGASCTSNGVTSSGGSSIRRTRRQYPLWAKKIQ